MKTLITTNIVAGVVIKRDNKYLLVQENCPGGKIHELWNFPAGKVDEGETIEEAAIREAKEESGYEVELIRKIDIFQAHAQTPPKHAYEARIIGGELTWPKDEILNAGWFTLEEIKNMKNKLRSEYIMEAITIMENGK
ncbi:MAG: NUDIX domain-containing protein [Patescibacteria group bacterium]